MYFHIPAQHSLFSFNWNAAKEKKMDVFLSGIATYWSFWFDDKLIFFLDSRLWGSQSQTSQDPFTVKLANLDTEALTSSLFAAKYNAPISSASCTLSSRLFFNALPKNARHCLYEGGRQMKGNQAQTGSNSNPGWEIIPFFQRRDWEMRSFLDSSALTALI